MRNFTFPREFYITKGRPVEKVVFEGGEAYKYRYELGKAVSADVPAVRYGLTVFFGKQNKPVSDYTYRNEKERDEALARAIAGRKSSLEFKAKMAAERKAGSTNANVEVGDIFVSSGGYDQTNVEALQVVEKVGKSMVRVKRIGFETKHDERGGPMSEYVVPLKDSFMEGRLNGSDLRKVQGNYIKGTWGSASKWDGKRSYYSSWYH
jgi:hypothetical protein